MSQAVGKPSPLILITNHMDAWGVTFTIVSVFIFLHQTVNRDTIILLIGLTLAYWFGFAVNDYFDADIDVESPDKVKRNFFIHYPVSKTVFFLFLGIVIMLATGIGFYQFGVTGILSAIVALFIVWGYSSPPLRLKSRPGLDLLTHALFVQTFPYLICLILADVPVIAVDYVMLAFFFFSSLSAQLEQQIRDYEIDKLSDSNFTVQFGKSVSGGLLTIFTIVPIAILTVGFLSGILPVFMLPLVGAGVPLAFHRFLRGQNAPRSEKLIRVIMVIVLIYVTMLWIGLIGFY